MIHHRLAIDVGNTRVKLGFFAWFVVAAVHVLAYLRRVPPVLRADLAGGAGQTGARARSGITMTLVVLGCVFGLAASSALGILGG